MKLYRAFATVGGLTMVSRALGFARDILIAATLGSGAVADAFFVAFRFPNLFRRLFGEGAFNAAFVPLFAKRIEGEGREAARSFAEEALAGLLFLLLLITALAEIAMPWLMYLLAPGFSATPEKFDLAVLLTRIAFPYLLCMSLVALLSGALNAVGRFSMAAAAPILLNVVLIAALLLAAGLGLANTPQSGVILAWGVAVAGFVQLAALWIAARRAGLHASVTDNQNRSVEFALLLTLPAAVALAVAAEPIIRVLFERGAFTPADTLATAAALAAFAFGLPAFVLIKVLQPAFFAREDTRTPMRYAVWNMALNVAGSVALFFLFRALGLMPHAGIAIATTLAAWANVYLLWSALRRRGHFESDRRLRRNLPMIGLASAVMGAAVWAIAVLLVAPLLMPSAGVARQAGALALVLIAGLVIYALAIQLTGVIRWGEFLQRLVARGQREA
jgi:peptidoglycan biosynthesis protein MviN/MurJ (putative lipid II flippase)